MKALVTGGAGFIGSHTVKALLRLGHQVTVIDDLSTGCEEYLPSGCVFVQGDVRDRALLTRTARDQNAVIHLAAYVSLPDSFEHPEECLDINVGGTANVMEAACQAGVSTVVLASSSAVYAGGPPDPKHEKEKPQPGSPYAESKLQAEGILRRYKARGRVHGVALRYFNVYGPYQSADSDYAAVIPIFVERALAGQTLVVCGDGRQTRDFVYVEDVAMANIAALSHHGCGPYNIGTGQGSSILALGRLIIQLTGSRSDLKFAPSRPGDVPACTADIRRARDELGWSPTTSLSSGLAETIGWWEQQRSKHPDLRPGVA